MTSRGRKKGKFEAKNMNFKDETMRHTFSNHIEENGWPDAVDDKKQLIPKHKPCPLGLSL